MNDINLALGFFWLTAGILILGGALLVRSLKRNKKRKK